MKKSLVALAALAVVGAASAQVSITGTISFSQQTAYGASGVAGNAGASKTAQSDGSIFLGGSEDIGGGNTVSFSSGFDANGRVGAGTENSSLSVGGGWGTFGFSNYESHSPIDDNTLISGASQNAGFHDTKAFGIMLSNRLAISYATPSFSGFVAKVGYIRNTDGTGSKYALSGKYTAGGLTAYLEADSFDNTNYGTSTVQNSDGTANTTTVNQAGASAYNGYVVYDAGVVKVAAGYNKNSYDSNGTTTVGVNVPLGAFSIGADAISYNNAQGYELGAVYSLSKLTSVQLGYGNVNNNALLASGGAWVNNSQYRLGLFHSF